MPAPRRIDVHHHMVPASYARWLAGLYEGFAIPDAQRASIDRGAAEQLFPRLRRTG
ncbi:MAG TPA: hypothetical protein VII78_03990 [Myxococcota bacterium]|jgi:hypothetical protein